MPKTKAKADASRPTTTKIAALAPTAVAETKPAPAVGEVIVTDAAKIVMDEADRPAPKALAAATAVTAGGNSALISEALSLATECKVPHKAQLR